MVTCSEVGENPSNVSAFLLKGLDLEVAPSGQSSTGEEGF